MSELFSIFISAEKYLRDNTLHRAQYLCFSFRSKQYFCLLLDLHSLPEPQWILSCTRTKTLLAIALHHLKPWMIKNCCRHSLPTQRHTKRSIELLMQKQHQLIRRSWYERRGERILTTGTRPRKMYKKNQHRWKFIQIAFSNISVQKYLSFNCSTCDYLLTQNVPSECFMSISRRVRENRGMVCDKNNEILCFYSKWKWMSSRWRQAAFAAGDVNLKFIKPCPCTHFSERLTPPSPRKSLQHSKFIFTVRMPLGRRLCCLRWNCQLQWSLNHRPNHHKRATKCVEIVRQLAASLVQLKDHRHTVLIGLEIWCPCLKPRYPDHSHSAAPCLWYETQTPNH